MRATLVTSGKATPTKGALVLVNDLIYIVTSAEEPTELDDTTAITEVEVQPAVSHPGAMVIRARSV